MNIGANKAGTLVRFITALVLLFNALVPSAGVVEALSIEEKSILGENTTINDPRIALHEQAAVYYQPPELPNPQRTGPEADEPDPKVPPRENPTEEYTFELTASPTILTPGDVATITVTIRNNTEDDLYFLEFKDQLEAGLEYDPSKESPISYSAKNREITHSIARLATGEETTFTYLVQVSASRSLYVEGEVWVHSAQLTANLGDVELNANTALGFDLKPEYQNGHMAIVDSKGEWNAAGNVSVYIPSEATQDNSILIIAPTTIEGKGPQMQFRVETYRTGLIAVDSTGQALEQRVDLKTRSTTSFPAPVYMDINLDSFANLRNIPAGMEPYVATYDEELNIWVKVPILESDPEANTVTVETSHFPPGVLDWGIRSRRTVLIFYCLTSLIPPCSQELRATASQSGCHRDGPAWRQI